jgi:DNA-binding FadR family transcriptional regulator
LQLSDDMMSNQRIIRISLADEVAGKIRQEIVSGKLKPGEQLPTESELAQTFGIGRSTVREAVKMLAHAGFIRVQQGVGMFVATEQSICEPFSQRLQRADNDDLDEVRKILEVKIAEKAALLRTKSDLKVMKDCLQKRRAAADQNDLPGCVDADIAFHTAIAVAAKNEILFELYQSLALHLKKWFIRMYQDTAAFERTQTLHEELLNSIEEQLPEKAWKAASEILKH